MTSQFQQLHDQRLPILQCKPGGLELQGFICRAPALLLPDGIYDWPQASVTEDAGPLFAFLTSKKPILGDFFLMGTGSRHILPSAALREGMDALGLGLEFMDSAAASRTYNVLYAENRMFAAGFLLA